MRKSTINNSSASRMVRVEQRKEGEEEEEEIEEKNIEGKRKENDR